MQQFKQFISDSPPGFPAILAFFAVTLTYFAYPLVILAGILYLIERLLRRWATRNV